MKRIVTGLLCVSIVSVGMFFSACTPPVRGTVLRGDAEFYRAPGFTGGWETQRQQGGADADLLPM